MNRRDSIQKIFAGGTFILLTPAILQSCTKDPAAPDPGTGNDPALTIDLTLPQNSVLNNSGGSKVVQNVLVINAGSGFIALSAVCTHQSCIVAYNSGAGKIQCPCHGSEYSLSGNVLVGPAPAALQKYTISRKGDVLEIR